MGRPGAALARPPQLSTGQSRHQCPHKTAGIIDSLVMTWAVLLSLQAGLAGGIRLLEFIVPPIQLVIQMLKSNFQIFKTFYYV